MLINEVVLSISSIYDSWFINLNGHVKPAFQIILQISDIYMKFDFFSRKKFKCNVCGDKFKTGTEVEEHHKIAHPK